MTDGSRDNQPAPFGRLLDEQLAEAYRTFEAKVSKGRAQSTVDNMMQGVRGFCHYLRTGQTPARFEQIRWPIE